MSGINLIIGNMLGSIVHPGSKVNYLNILNDGNTVAWYDSSDLSTITKDENDKVSRWNDKLGSGHDLIQSSTDKQPRLTSSGVLFDGVDDSLKTAPFTFNKGEYCYLVIKQITWKANSYILDGNTNDKCNVAHKVKSPQFGANGGSGTVYASLPLETYGVIRVFFNDNGEGKLAVNDVTTVAFNSTLNMGGITFGNIGSNTLDYHGNFELKEAIFRTSIAGESTIYNYLAKRINTEFASNTFDDGKLVFGFDDARISMWTHAYPIMKDRGINPTLYVVGNWVGNEGYCTWANLKTMYDNGFDMQCHSYSHTVFNTLTEAQIKTEFENNNAAFTANNLPIPHHFAYPGGNNTEDTKQWIINSGLRLTARRSTPAQYILKDSDKYTIAPQMWIENILTDGGMVLVKEYLLEAKLARKAIMLGGHAISEDGLGDYEITTARFNEILDYCEEIGIDVITMSQLYQLMD